MSKKGKVYKSELSSVWPDIEAELKQLLTDGCTWVIKELEKQTRPRIGRLLKGYSKL